MKELVLIFKALQYIAVLLTICAFVAVFTHGVEYILWFVIGVVLCYGWKRESDDLRKELEL